MNPLESDFAAYLRDQEILSAAQLRDLLNARGAGSRSFRESLLQANLLDEAAFLAHWARMKDRTVLTAAELTPELSPALAKVPLDFCSTHSVLPLRITDGVLIVAMSDPTDATTVDDLRFLIGGPVDAFPASSADLSAALLQAGAVPLPDPEPSEEEESPVIREVRRILDEALSSGATHVHLEPQETGVVVLHRIEGALKEVRRFPAALQAGLTARLKILGELDIAERRIPQAGVIRLSSPRREIMISTLPTAYRRERITLQILEPAAQVRPPSDLGFGPAVLPFFERVARTRDGLFIVSGPGASGRTATLYGLATALASAGRNVLAVEENPQAELTGVTQVRPNPQASFPASMAVRHLLRHDADVLVVDPMADAETLESLLKAVQRRHLVLASMHARTPLDAVVRMRLMVSDGYVLGQSLRLVLGQRLVRVLCRSCRRPEKISRETAARHGLSTASLFQPGGCDACHGVGFRGRLPVGVVLEPGEEHRRWMEGPGDDPRRPSGPDGLREALLRLAADGTTSLAEALTAADA